jgi:hypothetical protein
MIDAEMRAGAIKATSGGHHIVFAFLIAICLFFAGLVYKDEQRMNNALQQNKVRATFFTPSAQPVVNSAPAIITTPAVHLPQSQSTAVSHQTIQTALQKVARDLNNRVDVNQDGLINCIDAAVLFYQYFPDKSQVTISVNRNAATGMHHLFNAVHIDGVWRAIEPQAVWANKSSYWMRDVWGRQYDSTLNRDVTRDYLKYVK